MCLFLIQIALLVGVGLLLGFRPDAGGLALLALLLVLTGMAMACFSYALALLIRDEGGLAASVNLFVLPLMLLSGIMLPITLAPDVLQNVAKFNPFAYAVDASRAMVEGHIGDGSVLKAFIIIGVLAIVMTFWATRSMRQAAM
jgi:ABC-2 type transport system permease protein